MKFNLWARFFFPKFFHVADAPFNAALKAIADLETGSTAGVPQVRVIESLKSGFIVKDR